MLNQVADGVWVRQSAWVLSNAIAVRGEGGLILVDPGIDGSDLNQLADDLDRLGIPVIAGFSTHPHWDHLLWHSRFGDVPRYATPPARRAAGEARERGRGWRRRASSGIPLELFGLVAPLPADGGPVPGEIVEHQAHAIGHAAVLLADRGVLLAGDMLSDVLIPLLDPRRPGQAGAYETALDRLGEAARHVVVLVPGHGAVAEGPEVAARLRRSCLHRRAAARRAWLPPRVEPGAGPTAHVMHQAEPDLTITGPARESPPAEGLPARDLPSASAPDAGRSRPARPVPRWRTRCRPGPCPAAGIAQ